MGRVGVDVDDQEIFLELFAPGEDVPRGREDAAPAIEDQLVLTAYHVGVADVDAVVAGAVG